MTIRRAQLTLLVCLVLMVTTQAQLSSRDLVRVQAELSVDNVHAGSAFQVAVIADLVEGWHINAHEPTLEYLIPTELSVEPVEGLNFGKTLYPDPVRVRFEFADQEFAVYEGRVIIRFPVVVARGESLGQKEIKATLQFQACSDQICLAPASIDINIPIQIVGLDQPSQPINTDIFGSTGLAIPLDETAGGMTGASRRNVARLFEEQGLLLALLSIFLLGLGLNLTPCVYHMIPISIGYFSHQSEGKTSRVFGLALMYQLGIAITYSTLGVIAALTGQMFGSLLQNPWVLVGIAAVMVALALSLFGVYQIRPPRFITRRISGRSTGGILGALSMGLVVGIVAAPCVGPVTIGLLTYVGTTGNPWLGFWMFFVLSLGLGTPYVVLAMFAGGLKRLPRSGVWLIWVERLFGFMLIGLALYFVTPLLPDRAVPWAVFILAVASGVYLGWLEKSETGGKVFYWLKKVIAMTCLAIGIFAVVPRTPAAAITWRHYHPGLLDQAREEVQPVILDFYADWCIPCRELERVTFSKEQVIEATKPFMMVKVDVTQYNSLKAELLRERFNVRGVPTIIFIDLQGNEVEEARVVGYVGPDEFLQLVKRVRPTG